MFNRTSPIAAYSRSVLTFLPSALLVLVVGGCGNKTEAPQPARAEQTVQTVAPRKDENPRPAPAPFESIISAMSIPVAESYSAPSWEDAGRIEGVKWTWPHTDTGEHESTMEGSTRFGDSPNPNVGATKVVLSGARTMWQLSHITIANAGDNPSEEAVVQLFGQATVQKVASPCDSDGAGYGDAMYRFERAGYKPLFVRYQASKGASGDSGTVELRIASTTEMLNEDCAAAKQAQATEVMASGLHGVWRCISSNGIHLSWAFDPRGGAVFKEFMTKPIQREADFAGRYKVEGDLVAFAHEWFRVLSVDPFLWEILRQGGRPRPPLDKNWKPRAARVWERMRITRLDERSLAYTVEARGSRNDDTGQVDEQTGDEEVVCDRQTGNPDGLELPSAYSSSASTLRPTPQTATSAPAVPTSGRARVNRVTRPAAPVAPRSAAASMTTSAVHAAPTADAAPRSARVVCPNYTHVMEGVIYPREALKNDLEGEVRIEFTVSGSGQIKDAVIASSSNPIFNRSSMNAVSKLNCTGPGHDIRVHLPIKFTLR